MLDLIRRRVRFCCAISSVSNIEKSQRQLRIIRGQRTRTRKLVGGFNEISSVAIQRAQIVMRLQMVRINLQDARKFCNRFRSLATLGQQPTEIIARADKILIEPESRVEFGQGIVGATRAIKNHAEQIMRDGRTRRDGDSPARIPFGFRQSVLL